MRLGSWGLAVAVAAVVGTAGCSSEPSPDAPATWAADQDHVAAAEMVPWDDPADGTFLHVELDAGLPDATVEDVVHGLKEHFDDAEDRPSIEVDVDGFEASVYPGLVTFPDGVSDPDLDRALWLRADGRATSYGDEYHSTTSSHPRVIAPAADVAQLAIDFDVAVTHAHDVRGSMSVESADGTTGVDWTTSTGLAFGLDPEVVGEFARLQKAHPGTTGWLTYSGGPWKAFIDLSPDDVTFAEVASGKLVDATKFADLQLGWGPARAEADRFSEVFADSNTRAALDALRQVDGVAEIGEEGVVVRDGSAFAAALAYATASDHRLRISLQREPVLYDFPTTPVFETSSTDSASIIAVYTAIADLPGIVGVDLNTLSEFGNLTVDHAVTPAELDSTFTALAALPAPYARTEVYASVPADYGHDQQIAIGTADAAGLAPAKRKDDQYADLVARVQNAWDDVRTR